MGAGAVLDDAVIGDGAWSAPATSCAPGRGCGRAPSCRRPPCGSPPTSEPGASYRSGRPAGRPRADAGAAPARPGRPRLRRAPDGAVWAAPTPDGPGTLRACAGVVTEAAWGPGAAGCSTACRVAGRGRPTSVARRSAPAHRGAALRHFRVGAEPQRPRRARPGRPGAEGRRRRPGGPGAISSGVRPRRARARTAPVRAAASAAATSARDPRLGLASVWDRGRTRPIRAPRIAGRDGSEVGVRSRPLARLRALPGVGVWTAAETPTSARRTDEVSVGDYHLPDIAGWVLAGGQHRRADARTARAVGRASLPGHPHAGAVRPAARPAAVRGCRYGTTWGF